MIMASATPAYRKLFIGCQVALAGLAAFVVVRHRLRSAPCAIDFEVFGDEAVKKPQFSWADVSLTLTNIKSTDRHTRS